MKRSIGGPGRSFVLASLLALLCAGPLLADHDRLHSQVRDRQRVVDAERNALQQQVRTSEFGGRLYWQLRRSISALEQERSALSRLDSALGFGREQEIERRHSDYRRAQQESMRQGQELARTRARELQFGSRAWHENQRLSTSLQQQRSANDAFGRQYRSALEAQIRFLETHRSQMEFGSSQWHAVNRQISALRQALRSPR